MKLAALALGAAFSALLLLGGASASAERPLKVGYVVAAGFTPNKNDLFGSPYAAFIRAVKTYGIAGRVLEVAPNQDATGPLGRFARERYDLIIMGLPDPGSLVTGARAYPHEKFLSAVRLSIRCAPPAPASREMPGLLSAERAEASLSDRPPEASTGATSGSEPARCSGWRCS